MIELSPLPMQAAQEFWASKIKLSPGEFKRLSREARTKAFAVSGIARGHELATVFEALGKAIDEGITFDEFRERSADILESRGWGRWRSETIFRTNIQTAYNVGRYREMMETARSRPYWQYSAVNDSRTRPAHAALNGKVFPSDHPFWDTWYPPNGFNCRCGVVSLAGGEVRRRGLTVESHDPTGELVEPSGPITGNPLPARPLMPDPGWMINPGKSQWGGIVEAALKPGRWDPLPGLAGPDAYGRKALADVRVSEIDDLDESMRLPAGRDDEVYRQEFIRRYGKEKLVEDALGEPVILSLRSVVKGDGSRNVVKPGDEADIPLLERILTRPYEIWLTPQKNETGRIRLTKRYMALWKTGDKQRIAGLSVYEVADGVFSPVTQFIPLPSPGESNLRYAERQRAGILLYGEGSGRKVESSVYQGKRRRQRGLAGN